jgi:hypothetical protein
MRDDELNAVRSRTTDEIGMARSGAFNAWTRPSALSNVSRLRLHQRKVLLADGGRHPELSRASKSMHGDIRAIWPIAQVFGQRLFSAVVIDNASF